AVLIGALPPSPGGAYFLLVAAHPANAGSFAGSVGEYRASLEIGLPMTVIAPLEDDAPGNLF
ncbi:MAG: hypothetical protein ACREQ9_12315, partial [Candidatus Binatia bacterium]